MRARGLGPGAWGVLEQRVLASALGMIAIAGGASPAAGQSIERRIAGAGDGRVQVTYASRAEVCGDGRDLVAVGDNITIYPSMQGHGWSNATCLRGPARAVLTVSGGRATAMRVHVGPAGRAAERDLGVVPASEAAEYFLSLAARLERDAAKQAIMAAAIADSIDISPRLLALARDRSRDHEVRTSAMYWLAPLASGEAVAGLAAIARDGDETRRVREGALAALSQMRDGAGVPTLIELAGREASESGLRTKAVFWLGNAKDERGRRVLRTLAERDTTPARVREQAIFALGHLDEDDANGEFLRALYARLSEDRLREKIIQSVAQQHDQASERWLLELALNEREPVEMRKKALFWRGQADEAPVDELIAVYPRLRERELKEHFTFVLSQRHERDAVDKLIDIARNDGDREVRRKAIFWLGQSDDARAVKFLQEAIDK